MSGVVGIWNLDGRPVDPVLLSRMSGTLVHRGLDGEHRWVEGAVGLACQLNRVTPESAQEIQPLVSPDGIALVFDGRLDNREELLERLDDGTLASDASDPELIIAAYRAAGDDCSAWLNGDVALALFDRRRQRLLLARDCLGIRPLYYCRTATSILFASEIKALLAHPAVSPQPNDDLLADFLLDRIHDQEITFFTDIFSVLPAHMVLVTPQGLRKSRYWDFDLRRQIRLRSFDDYAEAFRELLTQAVRRRLRSRHPVAVSVSGGLDSSSVFCLAQTLRLRERAPSPDVVGVSYTTPAGSPSDERSFLTDLEQRYELSIHRVPIEPEGFLQDARAALWHLETPCLDEQWAYIARFMTTLRELGARTELTGHWGDQMLFPQAYLVDLARQGAWGRVRAHLREFPRWMPDVDAGYFRRAFAKALVKYHLPPSLFVAGRWLRYRATARRPWYAPRLRERALQRHWHKRPLGGHAATAHARELYEQARGGYHVLCLEWDNKAAAQHGLETTFPYLDRELLSWLMAIPGETLNAQGVPKALLRAGMAEVLPASICQRRWKADFTHLVNDIMRRQVDELLGYLSPDSQVVQRGYVDFAALRAQIRHLKTGLEQETADAAWALTELVGLELWLQTFFGHRNEHHMRGVYATATAE